MTEDDRSNHRRVYSSETGRISRPSPAPVGGPAGDGVVRVSRTKAGRRGRTVTVVTGVPAADLPALAKDLRRLLGTGGAAKDGAIEVQGDHRDRLLRILGERYRVKPAGG